MHNALWIVPILPFVLCIAQTWNAREAIEETVWFNVAYVLALGIIYLLDITGYDLVSTSPTGAGGGIALIFGFAAMMIQRRRWTLERRREKARKEAERKALEERRARGEVIPTAPRSPVGQAFHIAGEVQRAWKSQKRS